MRKIFLIILPFLFCTSLGAQDDIVLHPKKVGGKRTIKSKWVASFQKNDLDTSSIKFNKKIFSNPTLFKLQLFEEPGGDIGIHGLGSISDTLCLFSIDSNNDKDLQNDKLLKIPINKPHTNSEIIKCEYEGGNTWIQPIFAQTDKKGNLSNIEYKIHEYRLVEIQENGKTYNVRIEPLKGMDYSYPYFLMEGTPNKLQIGEYLVLENSTYLIKSSNKTGDSIKLQKVISNNSLTSTQIGFKAHEIIGKSLKGDTISLNELKGKYVLLDFWYMGCGACIMEMKDYMKEIYDLYGGEKFEILGINVKDDTKPLTKFLDKNGYTWSQLLTPLKGNYVSRYNVFSFPTYFLIDSNGIIIDNDLWGIATLPYILNQILPDDYLTEKLLSKRIKFSYKENLDAKYHLLRIESVEGKKDSYILYKKDNEWKFSLDLPKGEYLYYFYFDGLKVPDSVNPNRKIVDGQVYSILTVN